MPYKASEHSCALVNFTDGKLCCCQQKPAWKIRGILRKDRLLSKSYKNRNAGVLGQVFSEAKSIPSPVPALWVSPASESGHFSI